MSSTPKIETGAGSAQRKLTRRDALAKLGLAAGIAYTAPTVVHLDRSANAQILPTPCRPGKGKGGRPCITPPTP
ncbi:MAG: hypothetical protein U1E97_11850 [Alphaproteobacteria bacterium]